MKDTVGQQILNIDLSTQGLHGDTCTISREIVTAGILGVLNTDDRTVVQILDEDIVYGVLIVGNEIRRVAPERHTGAIRR
jgi:hypothetical protein